MDKIASFASRIDVMKPNKFADDKPSHDQRFKEIMAGTDYAAEEKLDGCRYKMIGNRFFSKDNVEKTDNFPHLRDFFTKLGMKNIVLDGEIYYPGKTSQYCTHVTGAKPHAAIDFQDKNGKIQYMIYDILRTPKANWTTENTYKERRKLLEYFYNTFIKDTDMAKYIQIVDMRINGKQEYLDGLLSAGKEGIVLKKLTSKYQMGKKPMWEWMKVKQEDDTDLIITGFEQATKHYTGKNLSEWKYWLPEYEGSDNMIPVTENYFKGLIGSIVFSAYVDGVLTRICTASGISDADRHAMTDRPNDFINRVARVTFMEKTPDGYPRHPNFKNMHEDKQPHECTWEF